jgi:hypothetical protein
MAILCVLYDSMAPISQILGQFYSREWHVLPVESADLLRNPDGSGALRLSADGDRPRPRAYLSADTMRWVDRWEQLRDPSRYLFASGTGRSFSPAGWLVSVKRMFERAGVQAQHFGYSSARLGMATDLLQAGTSAHDIRDVAGWRSEQPVMRLLRSPARAEPTRCLAEMRARAAQPGTTRHSPRAPLSQVMGDLFEPTFDRALP